MVLLGRIELPTSALPRMRSTTELQQHTIPPVPGRAAGARGQGRAIGRAPLHCQATGSIALTRLPMSETDPAPTREQRLAAKLRENLKRRKEQARAAGAEPALPKREPGR